MKKGFFTLLALLLICNFAYAETTNGEIPQGDVEDFFDKVKAACEDPDSVGNQKPPENIMFKCEAIEKIWMPGKSEKYRLLKQWRKLHVSIYCDKDVGDLEEWFKHPMTPVKAPCPRYTQYKVKKSITVQGMSCEDIKDIDSIVEFCEEKLEDADPEAKPTGRHVDFCGKGPGQKPPHKPRPEPPSTDPVPVYTPNLNYSVK